MPFKIVRNDITKMHTEAIVNTANDQPTVGTGCDHAVYQAAGYEELLAYRREHIGAVKEGDAFITPGFRLPAKYIIHAVSPLFIDGNHGEEELLRSCYRKSLEIAEKNGIRSVAFPLISTGGFGYPKEEGMRIAVDEIHAFLLKSDLQIYLVVFDEKATRMGKSLYPDLETYIDLNYVQEKRQEEYGDAYYAARLAREEASRPDFGRTAVLANKPAWRPSESLSEMMPAHMSVPEENEAAVFDEEEAAAFDEEEAFEELERKLGERMAHMSDTFPQYLLYLIEEKGMENAEVYKRAIVNKKVFSKIKNNPEYHPQKLTALCLCIGAKLTLDESKDLLARAGYALSPCDKTDIIFSYFIEHGIYDMIELDIQLEEHGLPCIIT